MKIFLLRNIWTPSSFHSSENHQAGFKTWLASGNFHVNNLNSSKSFNLSIRDIDEWKNSMASDCIRYAINSIQSIHSIRTCQPFPKLNGWQMIQVYYAAFFAAHSTLRLFGKPFSYFEGGHTSIIKQKAKIEGIELSPNIATGNFLGSFNPNDRSILFQHYGDSHKDLWKVYSRFLDDLSNSLLTQSGIESDLSDLSIEISGVSKLLRDNGRLSAGNWLSTIRNEINYQATQEFWYPFSKNNTRSADLFGKLSGWKSGSITHSDCENLENQHERFFATCVLISQISKLLVQDYLLVSEKKSPYAKLFDKFDKISKGTFEV